VASVFIIQVHSKLQPDPNEETAALLRVLIYKIDNTTFGDNAPVLPQWNGPPRTIVNVQSILYASLATALLSAFLAMLGKQWLNRYASVDMRGSVIERSQNRQRKLDGIIAWYFNHVLESLPLMLQLALLLLGCALSQYLWGIDITIASVVLGVTALGVLFYLFIVVAGVASEGCPYQTPWTNIIRYLLLLFVEHSSLHHTSVDWLRSTTRKSATEVIIDAPLFPLALLRALAIDALRLGRLTFRTLVSFTRRVRGWALGASPILDQAFDYQVTKMDFRCISWMLQTSSDKTTNLLTLNFLKTILALPGLNSAVVLDCFNVFSGCISTADRRRAVVTRGSEQLAEISATCFLDAFTQLLGTETSSNVGKDMRQRYKKVFPSLANLQGLPSPFIAKAIHHLFAGRWGRPFLNWGDYNPSSDELVPFAHTLAQVAQIEYRRRRDKPKVPRWLLRFALRFLSQNPLPPTPVIIDCLTMIAIDLGCHTPNTNMGARDRVDQGCVSTNKAIISLLTPH
jgi:hypothetical protein